MKKLVWIGGLLIAAIISLAGYDIYRSYQAVVRDTGRELDTQARIIAEQTARSLQAVDVVLRHLAEQSRRGAFDGMSERELYGYLREQAIGLVQVQGLLLVEPSGVPRAVSMRYPMPKPPPNVSGFPMFKTLSERRDAGMQVGGALQSDVDGAWVFPMARRVEGLWGEFAGVVGARGKVDYFQEFYKDLKLGAGSRITLLHRDGIVLARHPHEEGSLGRQFPQFQKLLAENGGTRPARANSPLDGVDRFGALYPVPDYPLFVAVARDADVALAPWRQQSLGTALRTLALSAFAAGLIVLLMRQLRRLQVSRERYALAVAGSDDGVWDFDFAHRRVFASARARELSGLPPGPETQSMDEWFAALPIHPEDAPRRIAAMDAHMAGQTPAYEGEFRLRAADGNYRWVRIHGLCIRDADGKPYRMAGSISDVDARRRAEEALKASEEQYKAVFNATTDALILRDPQERIVDVNPAFLEMNGLTREEVMRERSTIFAPIEMHARIRELYRRARNGETVQYELSVERKQGERAHLDVRLVPVLYRGEWHSLSLARDITAQKRAEAERARLEGKLLQSKKLEAIGTLAGGIAHDFNNILAAILGYGDMAQRKAAEGTPLRRHLDAVVAAGQRAKSLVERILAFSRSGVGERTPVHVQSVVVETLDLLAASLPAHVRLERRLSAGDAAVMGDATQIHEVAMNLCTNAVQAMKSKGTLTVSLDVVERDEAMAATSSLAAGRYVRLVVRDTGSGIPPQVLERIFDPFFTTREVGVGTGLGLSLVHGIVTELGGGIDVDSKPGAGTAFTVYLPWSAEAPVKKSIEEQPPQGDGETILLVDDEEALVRMGEEMVAELGYEPVGFTSSAAALAAFRESPDRFQAVLSDEAMPDMTGADLAREIRAIRPGLPIVLMSGYVSPLFVARARNIGVVEVLAKPLVARDIARSLASALKKETAG